MLFAVFLTPKSGTAEARRKLSKEWAPPAGVRNFAWIHFPGTASRWIQLVEADDVAALMSVSRVFDDLYEIEIRPAEMGFYK
jgi:hypothetical protein